MDHYDVDVFVLPSSGGAVQVFGYGNSFDWCRYPSFDCLHWLLDPTSEDAPVVQMAYVDQSCAIWF